MEIIWSPRFERLPEEELPPVWSELVQREVTTRSLEVWRIDDAEYVRIVAGTIGVCRFRSTLASARSVNSDWRPAATCSSLVIATGASKGVDRSSCDRRGRRTRANRGHRPPRSGCRPSWPRPGSDCAT